MSVRTSVWTKLQRAEAPLELAGDSVRVNAICPGTVDTPMVQDILAKAATGGLDRVALHSLKRISTVEDQAAAAVLLCNPGLSPASR